MKDTCSPDSLSLRMLCGSRCPFISFHVLSWSPSGLLRQAVQAGDVFPQDVEFEIHDRSDGYVGKVRMRSGIGDDRDLETVVGRFADGERDTVDGHGTFVDGEIALLV